MKKTKIQKGITLIALIITIVVLLILAVVAIGAVQESKIIAHAQNAAGGYNQAKANELGAIAGYETLIEDSINKESDDLIPETPVEPENPTVTEQKILTLTSDTDAIFTTEYTNLFNGYPSGMENYAKLTYKSGEDKLEVYNDCTDTMNSTYLIHVKYYKNGEVSSTYTLRGTSNYFNDDGTSGSCHGYTHYIKGWNDSNNIISTCAEGGNIYGALSEFPEFIGDWEIDTENSNDYGIQYLQSILVEK